MSPCEKPPSVSAQGFLVAVRYYKRARSPFSLWRSASRLCGLFRRNLGVARSGIAFARRRDRGGVRVAGAGWRPACHHGTRGSPAVGCRGRDGGVPRLGRLPARRCRVDPRVWLVAVAAGHLGGAAKPPRRARVRDRRGCSGAVRPDRGDRRYPLPGKRLALGQSPGRDRGGPRCGCDRARRPVALADRGSQRSAGNGRAPTRRSDRNARLGERAAGDRDAGSHR